MSELVKILVRVGHFLFGSEFVFGLDIVLIIFLILLGKHQIDIIFINLLFMGTMLDKFDLQLWISFELFVRRKGHRPLDQLNVSLSAVVGRGYLVMVLRWDVDCAHLFRDIAMRGKHLLKSLTNILCRILYLLHGLLISIPIHILKP